MLSRRQGIIVVGMTVALLLPTFAMGAAGLVPIVPQSAQGSNCNGPGGCQNICDLATLAHNVLNDAIVIAVFLAALLFAFAGFKMVTAPANAAQYQAGKKLLVSVLIGFLIILGAWLIVNTIMSVLFTGSPTSWNKLC